MSADPRLARMRQQPASTAAATPPRQTTPQAPAQQNNLPTQAAPTDAPVPTPSPGVVQDNDKRRENESFKLKFCTVCASNNNRSMEGHLRLADAKYPVISFGTGSMVRLPGPAMNLPNTYNFNVASYDQMYKELEEKDPQLYRANGILKMLERNRQIKTGPERWQDWRVGDPRLKERSQDRGLIGTESGMVDIVITCEERCWDSVVDDLLNRDSPLDRPVHVFNVEISDSHAEALVGGKAIVDLADSLNKAAIEERDVKGSAGWDSGKSGSRQGFDERVPDILAEWQERWPQFPALWTLSWF